MKVLVDSDFLVALARRVDSNHKKAKELLGKLAEAKSEVFLSNLVKFESATVVSKKDGMNAANKFVLYLEKFCKNQIFVDEVLEQVVWKYFLEQRKKGTSYIDCSNVIIQRKYKLDKIVAFDGFYSDEVRFE
jgi:predicted nucleic acid-binding protein